MSKKSNRGKFWKANPKHRVANCHVFSVKGKSRNLIPGHHFWKDAINIAQRLSRNCRNPRVHFIVVRKRSIIWPNPSS